MIAADTLFEQCLAGPETELDLGRACLLMAQEYYPQLKLDTYLARLDTLAAETGRNLSAAPSSQAVLNAMNQTLFQEQGFRGNADDYYDPRNSFLNKVLDRKLGIPITLSVLYMEIGQRLGLRLEGVSFPGHFLVKLPLSEGELIVDPFFGGIALSETDLTNRLVTLFGNYPTDLNPQSVLRSVGKKAILVRMLRNLKNIYLQKNDFLQALTVSNQLLIVDPESTADIRDRGIILEYLECADAAVHDYQHYLDLSPNAQDHQLIRARMLALHSNAATVH